MQSSENERDLEQDLLALVDYDKFSLVKQLIRNRATIVWCTRLARAENADAEKRIEVHDDTCSWQTAPEHEHAWRCLDQTSG